ncbi:MAG: EndoU domain-containing protein [Pseudomonadota bacterium]
MNKKTILTIVAVILVGLGVNLEPFGIDVGQLIGTSTGTSTGTGETRSAPSASVPATTPSRNAPAVRLPTSSESKSASKSTSNAPDVSMPKWSATKPRINLHHVFHGELNRSGKPVGFHARPGGRDPSGARVVDIRSRPNRAGVYTATVAIRDGGAWREKFSSFFPDGMSRADIVKRILNAYRKSEDPTRQPWTGPSGAGFDIQGYTLRGGDINTAFPIYRRD